MKKFNKTTESGKTLDAILLTLTENNILSVNEMIRLRGGDGEGDDPILIPPIPPTKGE